MSKDVIAFRDQAVEGFLNYQALKYDRSKIVPMQEEYKSLSFKEDSCYIGEIKLEETSYVCDAILPNFEVQNVIMDVERILNGSELIWRVVLKVNFFGLCLCVYHTKQLSSYYLGKANFFKPRFKIITKEDDPKIKRKDNMICVH
jgi:hypothetical protein